MPKRIPIARAREVGEAHPDVQQVILIAWDGKKTHVVTWGRTVDDCDNAARGGNRAKVWLGWPDELTREQPSRVKRLHARIAKLVTQLAVVGESESNS